MRVLFVYSDSNALPPPAKPLAEWFEISFAVSYLAGALEDAGYEISLVVLRHGPFKKEIERALRESEPQLVCFSAVATEFWFLKRVAAHVRRVLPDVYQAVGGTHVSLRPEDGVEGTFDAICVGEGDQALLELAAALEAGQRPQGIQNLWLRNGETIEKNESRPFTSELDDLPLPNREIWRPWIEYPHKHAVLLGRGCPFPCTYCSNHALWKLADGKYVRLRSADNVLAEVGELCERFPDMTYIYFEIETITADSKWAFDFARRLEEFNADRSEPLAFAINLRIHRNGQFRDLLAALRRAGFEYLRVGLESGSERVRRDVLKRTETNEDLIRTFDEARELGLGIYAYNLIGLPGETPEDFLETIELNKRCTPTRSYLAIFYPYPGTELENVCAERGITVPPMEDCAERYRAWLSLPEFPNRLVEHYFRQFNAMIAGDEMSTWDKVDAYLWQTIKGYPRLARFARRHSGHGVMTRLRRAVKPVTSLFTAARASVKS